jgi:ATP-dependent Clp protease ATP-binding subunit ClpA
MNAAIIYNGEFQMDHEVAKLIGSPPGYLGHREKTPALNQQRLTEVTSECCDLSLVLFDEIEKAAPSMAQLLLGILDKGILRLGDNTTVNIGYAASGASATNTNHYHDGRRVVFRRRSYLSGAWLHRFT